MSTPSKIRFLRRDIPRRFDWIVALVLLVGGAVGLYQVVTTTSPIAGEVAGDLSGPAYAESFFDSPNVGNVALLLFALFVTVLGGAWFVVRLLHWRFRPTHEPVKVWRQSLWVALFVVVGAWLQSSRALTFALGVIIAAGFVLLEVYLNVRER
ncbi:MAG TPA: hypothetical protein VJ793_21425 [Anaerolineae bacterium]|nr:hypothetical protein [Anaerolineae bacterium]